MTTFVEARDLIVQTIHTGMSAFPDVPVIYENTTEADEDRIEDTYLFVKIDFVDSAQVTLGVAPEKRRYGVLVVDIRTKRGLGTRSTLGLVDALETMTSCKRVVGVQFEASRLTKSKTVGDRECREMITPFYFDSIS